MILVCKEHASPEFVPYLFTVIDMILSNVDSNPYATRLLVSVVQKHNEVPNWTEITAHLSSFENLEILVGKLWGSEKVANECAKTLLAVIGSTDLKLRQWGEEFENTPCIVEILGGNLEQLEKFLAAKPGGYVGEHRVRIIDLITMCVKLSRDIHIILENSELPNIITVPYI